MTTPRMNPMRRLREWARENKDRSFEVRYTTSAVKHPYAIDLENEATQATVHVDCHSNLAHAVEHALKEAAKDSSL